MTVTPLAPNVGSRAFIKALWMAASANIVAGQLGILTITGVTNSGTTVTFTATNSLAAGQQVLVAGVTGFTTNNPNGLWTVISSGLSGSQFKAVVTNAPTGSYSSGGTASPSVIVFGTAYTVLAVGTGKYNQITFVDPNGYGWSVPDYACPTAAMDNVVTPYHSPQN